MSGSMINEKTINNFVTRCPVPYNVMYNPVPYFVINKSYFVQSYELFVYYVLFVYCCALFV